jgi:O-antigen/teichoic acid export membrane protein
MQAFLKTSFTGLLLRSFSMLGKFLIVVYIAKYFSTAELGVYGLFNSTIIIALYLLGFEFYNYSTREILAADAGRLSLFIRNQFIAFGFTYLIVLPVMVPILYRQFLPYQYFFWFYAVLISEHISIEFYRLFTILSRPVLANVIFFIKTGLWSLALIALWMSGFDSLLRLEFVWLAWFGGSFLACLVSLISIRRLKIHVFTHAPVDWAWIRQGFKVGLPFFIIAISVRLIEQAGRFFLDIWASKSLVGIYSFFWNIANLLNIVIFTAVIMILFPKLVETHKKNLQAEFEKAMRQFKKLIYLSSLFLALALVLAIRPMLHYLGKNEFYPYLSTYYILILAHALLNISYIPHYILYVRDADKVIMWYTVLAAVVNIGGNFILIPALGMLGAAISILLSYLVILGLKYYHVQFRLYRSSR